MQEVNIVLRDIQSIRDFVKELKNVVRVKVLPR